MNNTKRILAALSLGAAAFGALVTPASADPDPVDTVTCLSEAPSDLTALVDPAGLGAPSEVPGTSCLAP
ncbi:hypothetical protein OG978_03220 [Streptomyces sp. NBC_01591]|uniref:hypothetical protein n=1 Tax=Streptomyces sp. NBC_01591 TaxID=2975888 RepID=UPI002DDC6A0E|nr:hypothetical protein [Streptomyces sp. NBC_01591]WSD66483.1 hypothetical protein OG978_03220 [Streptomyces sp. NBC_01591]